MHGILGHGHLPCMAELLSLSTVHTGQGGSGAVSHKMSEKKRSLKSVSFSAKKKKKKTAKQSASGTAALD